VFDNLLTAGMEFKVHSAVVSLQEIPNQLLVVSNQKFYFDCELLIILLMKINQN